MKLDTQAKLKRDTQDAQRKEEKKKRMTNIVLIIITQSDMNTYRLREHHTPPFTSASCISSIANQLMKKERERANWNYEEKKHNDKITDIRLLTFVL